MHNEGKRCVVVLDVGLITWWYHPFPYFKIFKQEIEKTEDEKALWSLLMPWESGEHQSRAVARSLYSLMLGHCSPEAGKCHIDVRNVIWLGTSNVGEDLVFDHNASRHDPSAVITREEYIELMGLLRPRISARLGVSTDIISVKPAH